MKRITKWMTVLLAVLVVFATLPAAAVFADDAVPTDVQQEEAAESAVPDVEEPVVPDPSAEETVSGVISVPDIAEIPSDDTEPASEESDEPVSDDLSEDLPENIPDLNILSPSVTILEETKAEKAAADAKDEGKDPADDGSVELSVTNTTGMFNVVSASLVTENGQRFLVAALNGTGYRNLFKGNYEQAVANGNNRANWIAGYTNGAGKLEFRIPVGEGESYIPVVAISQSYLNGYEAGNNSLERAFYPRQLVIDAAAKTLVSGDFVYDQVLDIINNVKMFKPQSASLFTVGGPNSNGYRSELNLTMGSDAFDKVFVGTKEDAAASENTIEISERTFSIPVRWVEVFGQPETLKTLIGQQVILSFHSVSKDEWYERKALISEADSTLTFNDASGEETDPEKDQPVDPDPGKDQPVNPTPGKKDDDRKDEKSDPEYQDTVGGGTTAVDNSTALSDGVYTPDRFSFSGGSGRIVITCSKVEVIGGKAYATIAFRNIQSGSTEMNYVKASGGVYYCSQSGGASIATIPVELNKNNQILALTTKMSAAHEIAYTIFIYIAGADAKKVSDLTANKELDKEAPVIAGLEYEGEETLEKAEYFKIFNYSDSIRLLEIDMRPETKEKDATEENASEEKEEASSKETEETVIDDETGEETAPAASKADAQAELYKGNVIKYLIVPEDVEIPAGLDKETIVIQLPIKSVYSGSDEISKKLDDLDQKDLIRSQAKEDKENKDILNAGDFKKIDLKSLIKSKCDLVLLPEDSLKDKDARKTFAELAEDLANLDIPAIVDRSAVEKTEEGKAEWLKVYGVLSGCEEKADAVYREAVKDIK